MLLEVKIKMRFKNSKKTAVYKCFSYKQKEFLNKLGFREFSVGVHQQTEKTYWNFLITEEFEFALRAFTASKEVFK